MPDSKVRDLMVPKEAYATVSADGSIQDVVLTLREARTEGKLKDPEGYQDRAVLVMWQSHIIGKLTMLDVIRGLGHLGRGKSSGSKLGPIIESMTNEFAIKQKSLARLVKDASKRTVRDLLRPYGKKETIDVDASLDTALHQFITSELRSLLVTSDEEIVGILRLSDVYEHVSTLLLACQQD